MFNNINLSNALSLVDKPVWVITEVRGRNKNGRIYSKSHSKNVIYPGVIQSGNIWRGYSPSKGNSGVPKCSVEVCVYATGDLSDCSHNFILRDELLNVTVFETKEAAEKELAYLNAHMDTMTFSEMRKREEAHCAELFGEEV